MANAEAGAAILDMRSEQRKQRGNGLDTVPPWHAEMPDDFSYLPNGSAIKRQPGDVQDTAPKSEWPVPYDLATLLSAPDDPVPFIIPDFLPEGYATLLSSHGGIGKSSIALHVALCLSAGKPFCGLPVERRKVLYLSCEDDRRTFGWRIRRICELHGIAPEHVADSFRIFDLVGKDSILWARDPRTGHTATVAFEELARAVKETGAEVLVVDGITDTFGGNENDKSEVKQYVNRLLSLIPRHGALILVGHIAKQDTVGRRGTSRPPSEGYSGSVAWHNSVRARWFLYREGTGDDGEEPTGDVLMDLQKWQLSGASKLSLRFTWSTDAGMFVGREIQAATATDRAHRDRAEQRAVVAANQACEARTPPAIVPAATAGPGNAHLTLSQTAGFPEALRSGEGRRRFWAHLAALKMRGEVREVEYLKPDRHRAVKLACGSAGVVGNE